MYRWQSRAKFQKCDTKMLIHHSYESESSMWVLYVCVCAWCVCVGELFIDLPVCIRM